MGLRQMLGIFLVLIFLPINGPILRMLMESQGMSPIGELQFLGVSIIMLIIGVLMIFAPPIGSQAQSP
ncbi:MAG: hypothetical protein CMA89_00920 [Euryarchaeota archaeon]|nr:hypothetical protein [Euryarchaeota archaeon]